MVSKEMNLVFRMNGVNPESPLLYRITISGTLFYIGCANSARRPQKAYRRNLQRMIDGRPYRKNNPDGFRFVHRRMLEAVQRGEEVTIDLLRNVAKDAKFIEERAEIDKCWQKYGCNLLNRTIKEKTGLKEADVA